VLVDADSPPRLAKTKLIGQKTMLHVMLLAIAAMARRPGAGLRAASSVTRCSRRLGRVAPSVSGMAIDERMAVDRGCPLATRCNWA
jgi:hypothetical protein